MAGKAGVLLDVSFGGTPQPNSVTLSPKGDLRHDPTKIPFPLPDASVHTAVVTHVLEFLDPGQWYRWWDELHRVMRPGGLVYASGPYGGDESWGWLSEPAHRVRVVEETWAWLDRRTPMYAAHGDLGRRTPRPWLRQGFARVPGTHGTLTYNVVMQAVRPAKKER